MENQLTQAPLNGKPRPLKIFMVCDHFYPRVGGIETQVMELSHQLTQAGHHVTVICGNKGPSSINNIKIIRFCKNLLPGFKINYNPFILKELNKLFKNSNFDLVHIHCSVFSPLALLAIIAAAKTRLPSVLTNHSLLGFGKFWYRFLGWFYPWQSKTGLLTAVSQDCAKRFSIAAKTNCQILPNGIQHNFWDIAPVQHPNLNIVCVARMNIKKRVQDLIKVFAIILKTNPALSSELCLHLIGQGPHLNYLKKLVKRLNLSGKVQFHGYMEKTAIKNIFSFSDIFVLPCNQESFGIALAEALSAGLPAIAMNAGGTRDIIQNEFNGLLAENKKDLFIKLNLLINDNKLRQSLASRARPSVACFDWSKVLEKHLQLYEATIVSNH